MLPCALPQVDVSEITSSAAKKRDDNVENLIQSLQSLARGDLEDHAHSDDDLDRGEHLSDEERDLGFAVNADDFAEDSEDDFDEDDEMEKLHYPKQIFARDHNVSPLIRRIGLGKYAKIFDEHHITFDDFLHMTTDNFEEMGIVTFGAKRRLMRCAIELQHALQAPDDEDFMPPEYEGPEHPLAPGFYRHDADYLNLLHGIPEENSKYGDDAELLPRAAA